MRLKRSCTLHPLERHADTESNETKTRKHVPRHIELSRFKRDLKTKKRVIELKDLNKPLDLQSKQIESKQFDSHNIR
jgi:hypothetical protein